MKKDYMIKQRDILLRSITEDDIDLIRNWRNDENIRKYFLLQNYITAEQQLNWYNNYKKKDNDLMFIIEDCLEINKPIGAVALYDIDFSSKKAEFGRLMIGEKLAAGKGLGYKSTMALCQFGFDQLGLDSIYLKVFTDNNKALNVYLKCGFEIAETIQENSHEMYVMNLSRK
jgi:diamine N-acetyltransferase